MGRVTEPITTPEKLKDVRLLEVVTSDGHVRFESVNKMRGGIEDAEEEIERLYHEIAVRDRALRNVVAEHCGPDRDELEHCAETHDSYIDYFLIEPALAQARAELAEEVSK